MSLAPHIDEDMANFVSTKENRTNALSSSSLGPPYGINSKNIYTHPSFTDPSFNYLGPSHPEKKMHAVDAILRRIKLQGHPIMDASNDLHTFIR